ncbi:Predicted arabinose efflux permease, MFS family [Paenibacillus catalpae]|uniref:Predicted arabinose efflux permease, MFS family n=1 Tax=Paenibacillus catalpae TaxID=1045775 RepID=A0A1I2GLQ7_9BACL|nr:MFS transporter [Paenibacillus catalpae]SFF18515.1 Predicted arabinose efflux permease, MFS family [Paenibacillus catalpae]
MSKYSILFFLVMFMIGTDTFLISPLLPTLQAEYGVSTGIAGWMIGAYTLGSALFALISGPLSDGWNRRTVMICGLIGFSVSTALCGFADSFWMMLLFRFLAGVSAAFTAPQVWASIPAVMPPARIARTMGIAFGGLAAAQALGVPIGSWLAAADWPVPFWSIGAAALLLAGLAFLLLPDMKPSGQTPVSILSRYTPLMKSGKARSGYLAYLLLHLGSGTAMAFMGKWLADRFELSVGSIGTVMMALGFGTLVGSIISSAVTRKLGNTRTVTAGMLLLVLLYLFGPHIVQLPAAAMVYFIIFTVLGVIFPLVMGLLTALNASIRGTISSLANSTMNGANTLGAWLAGLLYVHLNGYVSIGIFSAVCILLSLGTFRLGGLLASTDTTARQQSESA